MSSTPDIQVVWRQSSPAFIVIQFMRNIRGLILPLIIILASRGISGSLERGGFVVWLSLLGGFVVVVGSVISWQYFRFGVSDRQLLVKSGFINKQERAVSFERIQSVDIEEAPLDRMFGVVRVRVETAAGGDSKQSDVRIEALTRTDAEDLRVYLIRARQRMRGEEPVQVDATADEAIPVDRLLEGELIRKISTSELLVTGATSGRIGPAAAIIGFAAQFADDLVPESWWNRLPWADVGEIVSSVQAVFAVVLILGLLAWLLSVISTVLSFGGFEIRRHQDQLLLRFGLLDRRRLTIPIKRMQAIRVVEGMLRQPFGLTEVRFESAGYNTESSANGVLFPLMRRADVAAFLRDVTPEFALDLTAPGLRRIPTRALSRYLIPGTVAMLVVVLIFILIVRQITGTIQWWSLFAGLLVPLVLLYSWLEFFDAGWQIDRDRLIARRRNGARETVITRVQRLQHRRLVASPLQRRAKLATFRGAVASGGAGGHFEVVHLDRDEGEYLLAALAPI